MINVFFEVGNLVKNVPTADTHPVCTQISDQLRRNPKSAVTGQQLLDAHIELTGGEKRPQQDLMLETVEKSLANKENVVVQAGTGTGKSLAYIFAVIAQNRRAVIATATNQLSEQLLYHDLPAVTETLETLGYPANRRPNVALLKGRNNYLCQAKFEDLRQLDARDAVGGSVPEMQPLFEIVEGSGGGRKASLGKEMQKLGRWAATTRTGDRTEAPTVSDQAWSQVSISATDCPGAAKCPFGSTCFTEQARREARQANIVLTNHAFLAQDMKVDGPVSEDGGHESLIGHHDVIILDEGHDFPAAFTGALTTVVEPSAIQKTSKTLARHFPKNDEMSVSALANVEQALDDLTDELLHTNEGALDSPLPNNLANVLTETAVALGVLRNIARKALLGDSVPERQKEIYEKQIEQVDVYVETIRRALSEPDNTVAWAEARGNSFRSDSVTVSLSVAPVSTGQHFVESLGDRAVVVTSATLTLGKDFSPLLHAYGFSDATTCVDVGSPFNYGKQGMLYVPKPPFPEPVGKERVEHRKAVLDEVAVLVGASGGRTLALFTTVAGAKEAGDHLRVQYPELDVYVHGEAPAHVLVQQFAENETSVLCATMGLWQGVNVPGSSCTTVIIDKIAFPPPTDALSSARAKMVEEGGGNGFREVQLSQAATTLAQAAGRLIRTHEDRGVVAVLDPRLITKSYGRTILETLPPFKVFTEQQVVKDALTRITQSTLLNNPSKTRGGGRKKQTTTKPGRTRGTRKPPRRAHATRKAGR